MNLVLTSSDVRGCKEEQQSQRQTNQCLHESQQKRGQSLCQKEMEQVLEPGRLSGYYDAVCVEQLVFHDISAFAQQSIGNKLNQTSTL